MRARNCKGRVRGECHPRSKLSDHDVWLIRELRNHGLGYKAIAKKMEGIPRQTVWNICNGRTRRALTPEEVSGVP